MEYTLIVPFKRLLSEWSPFINKSVENVTGTTSLIVDFNSIDFLKTNHFVVLACIIELFSMEGAKISFRHGTDALNSHLLNIKFTSYWLPGFNRDKITRALNDTTICLWKINREQIDRYSLFVRNHFRSHFAQDKDLVDLSNNLNEVFNNIFDHSSSLISGYVITQYYPVLNRLSFCVCDFGIGVAKSINTFRKSNGQSEIEDNLALIESLKLGVSTKSIPNNAGMGLSNILSSTENSNGRLLMWANGGFLIKEAGRDHELWCSPENFTEH